MYSVHIYINKILSKVARIVQVICDDAKCEFVTPQRTASLFVMMKKEQQCYKNVYKNEQSKQVVLEISSKSRKRCFYLVVQSRLFAVFFVGSNGTGKKIVKAKKTRQITRKKGTQSIHTRLSHVSPLTRRSIKVK